MPINMTEIPAKVGEIVGLNPTMAGITISIILTIAVLIAIAYLGANMLTCAIGGFGMILLFTALTWIPVWITIPMMLLIAAFFAGTMSGTKNKTGEE